jgi:hypothetical protein
LTSGGIGGGTFIALIAIVCLSFIFHRKHHRSPTEKQIDLSGGKDRNEEESEEEHFFDLESDADGPEFEDLTGCHLWAGGRPRGGDGLGIYFDGEESFSLFGHR